MHGRLGETLSFHGLSASRDRVCQHLCQPLTASHDAGLEPPWDLLRISRGSAGHILTLHLLVDASSLTSWSAGLCLPTTISAQRPAGGTNAMGGHRVQQEPHHCPPPGERCPGGTEAASPCGGLPAWPVCSAAMLTPWAHPLPPCWGVVLSPPDTYHLAFNHGFRCWGGCDCYFQLPQQRAISAFHSPLLR